MSTTGILPVPVSLARGADMRREEEAGDSPSETHCQEYEFWAAAETSLMTQPHCFLYTGRDPFWGKS